MSQKYHANAKTNSHIRAQIKNNSLDNKTLARIYNVSVNTIVKWKNADSLQDASSTPHSINYALSELEQLLIVSVRKTSWLSLDDVLDMVLTRRYNSALQSKPCVLGKASARSPSYSKASADNAAQGRIGLDHS